MALAMPLPEQAALPPVSAGWAVLNGKALKPFTLPHFRAWSADIILDSGDPFVLEPFQARFVDDVLASAQTDGPRPMPLYPEAWFIVPEGNGKSTLIALLALYFAEFEPFAAIPVAAASREQAEIIYKQAEGFVLRTPRLHEPVSSPLQLAKGKKKTDVPRFACLEGYRRINHFKGGRIQVFAADDRTGDGIIPTRAIIDEPHRQRDLGLYRTWAGKLTKRGGQIIAISTAGEPGTDFELTRERIRQQATKISRKGAFTRYEGPGIVVHEWALEADAKPDDFRAVKRANPFSGITIAGLREKYRRPTMTQMHWLRFVCNRPTRGANSAVTEDEWDKQQAPDAIPVGVPVWLGLDVAWKWDTTAAVPLWERDPKYRQLGEAEILVPPRDGSMLAVGVVKEALRGIHRRNPIHTVVMDMSFAADLAQWIADELGAEVIDRTQSNGAAARDFDLFMGGLRSGELWHSGDAGLRTHVLNAIARPLPMGDFRFDRPNDGRDSPDQPRRVIDGLSAASMVNSAVADRVRVVPVEFFAL